jgi:hypothetical protein
MVCLCAVIQSYTNFSSMYPSSLLDPILGSASLMDLALQVCCVCSPLTRPLISVTYSDAVFYDVYSKLADMNLSDLNIEIAWDEVDVAEKQGVDRWGRTREYFSLRLYRLPIGSLK